MSAGGLIVGCAALLFGLGLFAVNKSYGRALERWNAKGPFPKINRMTGSDRLLRHTSSGRYPFIDVMGVAAIVIGIMAFVIEP